MARLGVIADIHGNLEALEVALAFLDRARVDRVVCLGDVVGYNADPTRCVQLLEQRGIEGIAGNHDLIATGRLGTERCWYKAAHALQRTRRTLDCASRHFLEALPMTRGYDDGVHLMHGGVDDPTRYLRRAEQVREDARKLWQRAGADLRYCLYGHTHDAAVFRVRIDAAGEPEVSALPGCTERALPAGERSFYFINPGSIDAARKGAYAHAELAVLDTDRRHIRFERLAYDGAGAERKARAGGYRTTILDDLLHLGRVQASRARLLARRAQGALAADDRGQP